MSRVEPPSSSKNFAYEVHSQRSVRVPIEGTEPTTLLSENQDNYRSHHHAFKDYGSSAYTWIERTHGQSTNVKRQFRRGISKPNRKRLELESFTKIKAVADSTDLSQAIVDKANNLFKIVFSNGGQMVTSKSVDAIGSACLYITCRNEAPRTMKEISAASKVRKKSIVHCTSKILKIIKKKKGLNLLPLKRLTTSDFVTRFCCNLSLPNTIQDAAIAIFTTADQLKIVAESPMAVAAAVIYLTSQASETKRSWKEVQNVAGVNRESFEKAYRLMLRWAKELFPKGFIFATPIDQLPRPYECK